MKKEEVALSEPQWLDIPTNEKIVNIVVSPEGIPNFKFAGMWTPRDSLKCQRLFPRECRRYRLSLREKATKEVSNE